MTNPKLKYGTWYCIYSIVTAPITIFDYIYFKKVLFGVLVEGGRELDRHPVCMFTSAPTRNAKMNILVMRPPPYWSTP